MIKEVKAGYKIVHEKTGKYFWGHYKTLEDAENRFPPEEPVKHKKGAVEIPDVGHLDTNQLNGRASNFCQRRKR